MAYVKSLRNMPSTVLSATPWVRRDPTPAAAAKPAPESAVAVKVTKSLRQMPVAVPSATPWVRPAKAAPVAAAPMPEPPPPYVEPAAPAPETPAPYYGTAPLKKQADKYAAYKREPNRSIGSPPPRSKDPADHRERSIDRSSSPVRSPTIAEVAAIYEKYRTPPRGEDDDEGFTPESTEEDNDLGPPQPYVPEPPKPRPTHITKTVFQERDGRLWPVRVTEALPPPPSSGLMSSRIGVLPAAEGRPPMPPIRPRSPPATGRDT